MWRRCAILFLLLLGLPASAGQVTLSWDPNTEPNLTGYRLHRGTQSRTYTDSVTVGNVTVFAWTVPDVDQYFAATAYDSEGRESDYSNEVLWAPLPQAIAPATGVGVVVRGGPLTTETDAALATEHGERIGI